MIQITLNFSSMAAARKALNALPEDLFENIAVMAATADNAVATAKGTKAETKKEVAKPAAASTQPTVEATAAPEPKVESSAPAAVEYPVLQKAVFALAGKSREAAAAVAASFGVKTFKELAQDKWGDALAAVNAKLAEAA